MNINRSEVYAAIDSERDYQDRRWGDSLSSDRKPGNGERTIDEFALYIAAYTAKMVEQCGTFSDSKAKLDSIRKIAGLAVACMEQHGAPRR